MVTTAIVFDRRKKAVNGAEGALEIRVTIDRTSKYFPTGIKVKSSQFVAGVVTNRLDSQELNERLQIICRQIQQRINADLDNGRDIDPDRIRKVAWKASSGKPVVADWIDKHIPGMGLSHRTAGRYALLASRLREYGEIQDWEDVTVESLYAFNAWLHQRPGKRGSGARAAGADNMISDAGVHNYHKCFRAVLNLALRMDIIQANPYDRMRGEFSRGDKPAPDYLTDTQMLAIRRLKIPFGTMLSTARDICIVQMYTGLSWADLSSFDFKAMAIDDDGRMVTTGLRMKTSTAYVTQLLPPVIKVLEKYGGMLPMLSLKNYNESLKIIGGAVGLPWGLHSHALRHTYATWALRHGVPLEIVSKMMGHSSVQMTLRYAKIQREDVCREYDRLASGMK